MGAYSKLVKVFKVYPLLRGMASYSIIWPTSSLIQQTLEGKNIDSYDWWRCVRYGLYGSCYVAPTLYSWLTVANMMWPGRSIRAGIIKEMLLLLILTNPSFLLPILTNPSFTQYFKDPTFVETLTYTPLAMCSFYFWMSVLEMKPFNECVAEVKTKFWPTYKVGASIWPAVAMINFCLIPPRNRVPFISICSLLWTSFLAYMKHLEKEDLKTAIKTPHLPKFNFHS